MQTVPRDATAPRGLGALRCLVTGGAGFIGSHLLEALSAEGVQCVAYDDLSAKGGEARLESLAGVEVVTGDIRSRERIREVLGRFRPHWVIHLAAIHYIPDCERDPERAQAVNVGGTEALLDACSVYPPELLLLASSGSVYTPSVARVDEEAPLGPIDVYGRTKLEAEERVRRWHQASGGLTLITRFFNVYGPGESTPHLIPEIIAQISSGDGRLMLGNLDTRRDFIFVEDLVSALLCLLERPSKHLRVYNIGSGRAASGHEVVRAFEQALGRELHVQQDSRRYRPSDRPYLAARIERVRNAVGWSPKIDLSDGIRRTLTAN